MNSKAQVRRERKKTRRKQKKINTKLKKKLFGHLSIAPCCYCKIVFFIDELTVEHLTPLCLGGTNDPSNIALACGPCNHERGKKSWKEKQNSPEYRAFKLELARKHYEQYTSQHRTKDWQGSLQDPEPSDLHSQRENL